MKHPLAAQLPEMLAHLDWITDASKVQRLSRDFYWYSPVLEERLADKVGDVVVRPKTQEEIRQVVSACAKAAIPITLRGSGTGNYGQCTPLDGGVIMDMTAYNAFLWSEAGKGRAQAGIRLVQFDKNARETGWELRWLPSTFRSATLGGLFGGGFGGAGSLIYGPMAAPGNILAVKAMTVEESPQIIELQGADAVAMHHVYGTNGIVLEIEVALAPAYRWVEGIASFDDFDQALEFGAALAKAPAVLSKEVAFMAAPLSDYFTQLDLPKGKHIVLFLVEETGESTMLQMLEHFGGEISLRIALGSSKTLIEYAWNHTTLQVLKRDKNVTNIQTGYLPNNYVEKVKEMAQLFDGEVMMHVEFLRSKEGDFTCSGLEIIKHRDPVRLQEIMQIYRDHGVMIHDSHTYIVEEGKNSKAMPAAVIDTKKRFDPNGLLNPGKMKSWPVSQAAA